MFLRPDMVKCYENTAHEVHCNIILLLELPTYPANNPGTYPKQYTPST